MTLVCQCWGSHVDDPPAMTMGEVAGYLDASGKTVDRMAMRDALPGFEVAGTWHFRKGDIDGWIERQLPASSAKKREKSKT